MVVVVLALVAVGAFLWPGFLKKTVFDSNAVAQGTLTVLTAEPPAGYGISGVTNVVCPADQSVEQGTTFNCTATIDGASKTVPITVTGDDSKDSERGQYQVGLPQ